MPLSRRIGLALASVLTLPCGGLADVAPTDSCTAPACEDFETVNLLQKRGAGPMEPAAGGEDLSEADTSSTLLTEGMGLKKSAIIVIDMQNDFVHPNGTLSAAGANVDVVEPINRLLSLDWGVRIFTADNHPDNHVSFAKVHFGKTSPNGAFPIVTLNYSSLAGTTSAKICGSTYIKRYGEAGQICNGYPTPTGEAFSPDITVPQETYPAHCVQATWGQKIYDGLKFSYTDLRDTLFFKGQNAHIDSYSAIFNNLACNGTIEYNPRNGEPIPRTCIPTQKPWPDESEIPRLLFATGVERVFFVGLCLDYCVKYSSIHTAMVGKLAGNRWRTYVVKDATRSCNPSKYHVSKSIQHMKEADVAVIKMADVEKCRH